MVESRHYDREGQPLTLEKWAALFEDFGYRQVARTVTTKGKIISTIWLGLDHNFSQKGPPLIFETMVFGGEGDFDDLDCDRYATEEEALAGHAAMERKWLEW